jgi:hypothetical protein
MSDAYCDEADRERRTKKRKPRRDPCMVCGCPYTEKVNSLGHETTDECCDALLAKLKRVQAEHKRMKKIPKYYNGPTGITGYTGQCGGKS